MKDAIFVAATGQNVGKTTLCLGIMSALHKRFSSAGFIKPVGQQHVRINDQLIVDKDVLLFKDYFKLKSEFGDMSPVILPSGFTRDYLDGKINPQHLEKNILNAFKRIQQSSSYTLVEGTGHIGVGSIINLNNARVAALLNLDILLIASGGLGSAYDELILNIELCRTYNVKIKGIILNRVLEDKRAMIEDYFPKALKHLQIPLIGCVPYNEFLSLPTLKDFENLLKTKLIAGQKHQNCHFPHHRLIAASLDAFQNEILLPNELIITPATREDIILATLEKHVKAEIDGPSVHALILTSQHAPSQDIIEKIKAVDIPALYAPICSYDAMKLITSLIAKIRCEDVPKIEQAIQLAENNVDFDRLFSDN